MILQIVGIRADYIAGIQLFGRHNWWTNLQSTRLLIISFEQSSFDDSTNDDHSEEGKQLCITSINVYYLLERRYL